VVAQSPALHHIAAVAHHFLAAKGETASDSFPAQNRAVPRLNFAVAAASQAQLALLTSVTLAQAGRACQTEGWQLSWYDLGTASPDKLQALVTCPGVAHKTADPVGQDGLIWCLRCRELPSLAAAYRLGCLAGILQPENVLVLGFPDEDWAVPVRPGGRAAGEDWVRDLRQAVAPPPGSERSVTLARAAMGERPIRLVGMEAISPAEEASPQPNRSNPRPATDLFVDLAGQLVRNALSRRCSPAPRGSPL
jgi:hypothetical protein